MSHSGLRAFAAGVATSAAFFLAAWAVNEARRPSEMMVLDYRLNTGWDRWPDTGVTNPAPKARSTGEYVSQIAARCEIPAWTLTDNMDTTDVDVTTWIRFDPDQLSAKSFNCLTQFVRPPYVRLYIESAE
ncbi:hypothetical protein GCM10009106_09380 [Sphingomonas japonica]